MVTMAGPDRRLAPPKDSGINHPRRDNRVQRFSIDTLNVPFHMRHLRRTRIACFRPSPAPPRSPPPWSIAARDLLSAPDVGDRSGTPLCIAIAKHPRYGRPRPVVPALGCGQPGALQRLRVVAQRACPSRAPLRLSPRKRRRRGPVPKPLAPRRPVWTAPAWQRGCRWAAGAGCRAACPAPWRRRVLPHPSGEGRRC